MAFFRFSLKQIFATSLSMKSHSLSQTHCWSSTTANLLINSLGLSSDSALKAAQAIRLEPMATSDAVIAIFKSYGFSSSQIVRIFTKVPKLLRSNPKRTIEDKLAFLSESGIPSENLTRIVSGDPNLLCRSLHYTIMPCIQLLKTFFGNSRDIVSLLSLYQGTRVLQFFSESMEPNIGTLRNHGVPDKNIQTMLVRFTRTLSLDVHRFSEIVREVEEMGLSASGMKFIHTICTVWMMTEDKSISKVEVFKSLGWSDEQVRSLIAKQPQIMLASEQRLRRNLNQLSNELNWGPSQVLKRPAIILFSAEKRILPRYQVLKKLISMNLLDKNIDSTAFMISEDKFLNRYVQFYLHDIPELLDLYQKSKLQQSVLRRF